MGQTQGHELPFDIGEKFTCLSGKSIWEVHAGRRKVSGDLVTVFVFDYTDKSPDDVKKAQSAHLRLKTLRHPNILKYIDGIEKAISFLTKDCGLVHRNVCLSSVFVDSAGEWKLAGVEFMHPYSDTSVPMKNLELLRRYDPAEAGKPGAAKRTEKWSTDMWGLGCLVWEVYNGTLTQTSALRNTSKVS